MKKIEFIWREILYQTIEKRQTRFEQQELAALFSISTSTVNAALAPLRAMGAVAVGGRGFDVIDYEKILYHWANKRTMENEIVQRLCLSLPVPEIEGCLPGDAIPTVYTAYKERFGSTPADYDAVWCYSTDPAGIGRRFAGHTAVKGKPNLYILSPDPFINRYPKMLTLSHLFVDLWQMHDWWAKDFIRSLMEHINGLLS